MRVEHKLLVTAAHADRLVRPASHPYTAPSCLHAMFTLTIVFTYRTTPGWPFATAHRRTFTLTIVFTNRTTPGWPLATAHRRTFTLTIVFTNTHDPDLPLRSHSPSCLQIHTTPGWPLATAHRRAVV